MQYYFDFPQPESFLDDNYFVGNCNRYAHDFIVKQWPHWPCRGIFLSAASGAGKSHLGRIWARKAGALIVTPNNIDNLFGNLTTLQCGHPVLIDSISDMLHMQESLLHFYNITTEYGLHSLWLGNVANFNIIRLMDLYSRLKLLQVVEINSPDDDTIRAIFNSRLMASGVNISPKLLEYLLKRMPRSFEEIGIMSSRINHLVSISGHNPSIQDIGKIICGDTGNERPEG